MVPRVHIFVEREFICQVLRSLDDFSIDIRARKTGEADRVDSGCTMEGRIELTGGIVVICWFGEFLVLYNSDCQRSFIHLCSRKHTLRM